MKILFVLMFLSMNCFASEEIAFSKSASPSEVAEWESSFEKIDENVYAIDRDLAKVVTAILQNKDVEIASALLSEFRKKYLDANGDYQKSKIQDELKKSAVFKTTKEAVSSILKNSAICISTFEELSFDPRKKLFSIARTEPSIEDYPSSNNKRLRSMKGWSIPWDTNDTISISKLKNISCQEGTFGTYYRTCNLNLPKDLPEEVKEMSGNIKRNIRWCFKGPFKVETVKWYSLATVPVYYTVPQSVYIEILSLKNKNEVVWKSPLMH